MAAPTLIRTDLDDGLVQIGLNNGPVNALTAPFLRDFAQLMRDMAQDPRVRSIVLSSTRPVFSAGLNLKEAQHFDAIGQAAIVDGLNTGFLELFACPKPVVVAVDGAAIAGGLFFVLASDIRVCGRSAKFGLAEVRVGVDFPVGPMEIARATIPPADLRRMMLTGQPVGAEHALAAGIVDVIDPDPLARAVAQARTLAQIPPKAYAAVKHQIRAHTIAQITARPDPRLKHGWFTDETVPAMQKMIG